MINTLIKNKYLNEKYFFQKNKLKQLLQQNNISLLVNILEIDR